MALEKMKMAGKYVANTATFGSAAAAGTGLLVKTGMEAAGIHPVKTVVKKGLFGRKKFFELDTVTKALKRVKAPEIKFNSVEVIKPLTGLLMAGAAIYAGHKITKIERDTQVLGGPPMEFFFDPEEAEEDSEVEPE